MMPDWWSHAWQTVADQISENGAKILTGAILMGIGWYFGKKKAHANWKKREFYDRLNISLNTLHEGRLLIRTLVEKRVESVYLNAAATDAVIRAAQKTTLQDSTLPLPEKDYWYFLNPILNELSEKFARGAIERDLGKPVKTATYLVALTCECAGDVRMRKIRAMVIQKSVLMALPIEAPAVNAASHKTRWTTLNQLADEWKKHPWKFLEVELSA